MTTLDPVKVAMLSDDVARIAERNRILANELAWFVTNLPRSEEPGRVEAEVAVARQVLADYYASDRVEVTGRRVDTDDDILLVDIAVMFALELSTATDAANEALRLANEQNLALASELHWFVEHLLAFKVSPRVEAEVLIAHALLNGDVPPQRPDGEPSAAEQTLVPRNDLIYLVEAVDNAPINPISEAALIDAKEALTRAI